MLDTKKLKLMSLVVAEAIRELKEVPSGHLYASLMSKISLEEYQAILAILEWAKLIRQDRSFLLGWVGPQFESQESQENNSKKGLDNRDGNLVS